MSSLDLRFHEFMRQLDGVEALDETRTPDETGEFADYVIGQSVVVEVKSLEKDPSHKAHAAFEKLRERTDFPVHFGQVEIREVVRQIDGGEEILKDIVAAVTSSLETNIRKANRQIRSTVARRSITEPTGLLVILNEDIEILHPKLVAKRASQILASRNEHRELRYPAVTHVMLLSETHQFQTPNDETGLPIILIDGIMESTTREAEEVFGRLQYEWARAQGGHLIQHPSISDIAETAMLKAPKPNSTKD